MWRLGEIGVMRKGFSRRRWILAIASLLLATPVEAFAQRTYGPEQLSHYEYVTRHFVDCFANRQRDGIERWLATLPGSREERTVYRQLAYDFPPCWRGGHYIVPVMEFTPGDLRSRFAAYLVEPRVGNLPATSPLSENHIAWFEARVAALGTNMPVDREAVLQQNLVFCLARSRWADIVRFYSAKPDSADERTAVRDLTPAMASCIPAGVDLKVDRRNLREALGETLYHILIAPTSAQATVAR